LPLVASPAGQKLREQVRETFQGLKTEAQAERVAQRWRTHPSPIARGWARYFLALRKELSLEVDEQMTKLWRELVGPRYRRELEAARLATALAARYRFLRVDPQTAVAVVEEVGLASDAMWVGQGALLAGVQKSDSSSLVRLAEIRERSAVEIAPDKVLDGVGKGPVNRLMLLNTAAHAWDIAAELTKRPEYRQRARRAFQALIDDPATPAWTKQTARIRIKLD
jgi:hypothetical protein